jgi:3-phenylpropionate/trans-cinnamate dioxygenase ferredoxin subunit
MSDFKPVGRVSELPEGVIVAITFDGARVALLRRGREIYAFGDRCTHLGVSLARGGFVDDCSIGCWLHGARFDPRTGAVLGGPATAPLQIYEVRQGRSADGEATVELRRHSPDR